MIVPAFFCRQAVFADAASTIFATAAGVTGAAATPLPYFFFFATFAFSGASACGSKPI